MGWMCRKANKRGYTDREYQESDGYPPPHVPLLLLDHPMILAVVIPLTDDVGNSVASLGKKFGEIAAVPSRTRL
jgi:hypothetical protein